MEEKTSPYAEINSLPDEGVRYVDNVVHFSDIHIKPEVRHTEIVEAVKYMIDNVPPNSLFVLAGDVFQSKEKVTPSMIWTCREILELITESHEIIVINGNHDIYERRRDKIPLLRCICRGMKGVHYVERSTSLNFLSSSGSSVGFGISSLIDDSILPATEVAGDIKVAVAHVLLQEIGGKPDQLRCSKVSDFEGYDIALLGDIHEHTVISHCVYSGSLVRHTHGEGDIKGYGIYNLLSNEYDFIPVPTRYGMVTVPVTADGLIHLPPSLPELSYLRLEIPPQLREKIPAIRAMISEKTRIVEFTVSLPGTCLRMEERKSTDLAEMQEVRRSWSTLFLELLPKDCEDIRESIAELHARCYMSVVEVTETRNWKLMSLEMQNMFTFSDSLVHTFNFGRGIVRISGENASGKTSILKSIIFAIFGTLDVRCETEGSDGMKSQTEKGTRRNKAPVACINASTRHGYTKIVLMVNGLTYQIMREQKMVGVKLASSVKIERWKDDHWSKLCVGLCKKDTEIEIRKIIGTSSLFMYGNVLSQSLGTTISILSPADIYTLFFNTLALGIFSSLRDAAKHEEIRAASNLLMLENEKRELDTKISCLPSSHPAPADLPSRLMELDVYAGERRELEEGIDILRVEIEMIRSSLPVTREYSHAPPGMDISGEKECLATLSAEIREMEFSLSSFPSVPGAEPFVCTEEEGKALERMLETAGHILREHGWSHENLEKAKLALLRLDDVPIYYGPVPSVRDMTEARKMVMKTEGVLLPHHSMEDLAGMLLKWGVVWTPQTIFIPVLRSTQPRSAVMEVQDMEWMRYDSTVGKEQGISFPSFFSLPVTRPVSLSQEEVRRVLDVIYSLEDDQLLITKLGKVCSSHREQTIANEVYEWINHVMTAMAHLHFRKFLEEGERAIRGADKRRYSSVIHYHSLLRSQAGRRLALEKEIEEKKARRASILEWVDYKTFLTTVVAREEMRSKMQEIEKMKSKLVIATSKQIELSERIGRAKSAKEAYEAMLVVKQALFERHSKVCTEIEEAAYIARVAKKYLSLVEPKQAFVQSIVQGELGKFESLINEVLHGYVKYTVKLAISDKGLEIEIYTSGALITLSHLSGFELLMFELAIRLCLGSFSLSSHCSFLMIDEGLDVVDSTMIDNLSGIFGRLRGNPPVFEDILIVTHREAIDQYCQEVVPITEV